MAQWEEQIATNNRSEDSGMMELQDAVTCSIHLGLLDDPRMLPCGHAFCLECIGQCVRRLKVNESWQCPLCRQKCPQLTSPRSDAAILPRACLHNLIMHYIDSHKVNCGSGITPSLSTCSDESTQASKHVPLHFDDDPCSSFQQRAVRRSDSLNEVPQRRKSIDECHFNKNEKEINSILTRRKSLGSTLVNISTNSSEEFAGSADSNGSQPSAPPLPEQPSNFSSRPARSRHASISATFVSADVTPFSSVYQLYDIDAIRTNMKRQSHYQIHHRAPVKMFATSYEDPILLNSGYFLCKSAEAHPQVFLLNKESSVCSLLIRQPGQRRFQMKEITLKGHLNDWKPLYVQGDECFLYVLLKRYVFNHRIFKIIKLNTSLSIVGETMDICDDGELDDEHPADLNAHIAFCVSRDHNRLYLPLPLRGEIICIELNSLKKTGDVLSLGPYHPAYITQLSCSRELWISCPTEKCILILDEDASSIQVIQREQMNNAIPTHIITTTDARIIVLDAQQGQLFWLRRRNHYILLQRLDFHGTLRHTRITGIQALPSRRILILASDFYIVAKPVDSVRSNNSCKIL